MKARTRVLIGAGLVVGTVGYLMASGIKDTGVYFLTPTELAQRVTVEPSFGDVGVMMGARVVHGTIQRDVATLSFAF